MPKEAATRLMDTARSRGREKEDLKVPGIRGGWYVFIGRTIHDGG